MGDPKFARPKTQTPTHPWKQARIEEEHALKAKYGLKKIGGMREIWREKSALRRPVSYTHLTLPTLLLV